MIRNEQRHIPRVFTAAVISWLIPIVSMGSPACSNSDATPSTSPDASSDANAIDSGGSADSGKNNEAGVDGGSDAGLDSCVPEAGPGGCFYCPQTNNQILNQCSPSGDHCTAFDNATRLSFWDGGALPTAP